MSRPCAHSPVIEMDGVVKAFDYTPVLRGIDLRVRRGAAIALLGANGSGKTTLLRLIATLTRPTRGVVSLFGAPAVPAPQLRRRIGLLPHESLLYESLTVEENLRFFAGLYGLPPRHAGDVLARAGLAGLAGRRARVLSRGQRQQVNLARALLHGPELLILDEPYTGLDVGACERLTASLREGTAGERTIIFTSHDLAEVRALATGVAVLLDGRLTEVMEPDRLDEARLAAWFHEGRR